jgi:hypothetical protein
MVPGRDDLPDSVLFDIRGLRIVASSQCGVIEKLVESISYEWFGRQMTIFDDDSGVFLFRSISTAYPISAAPVSSSMTPCATRIWPPPLAQARGIG